MTWSRRYRSASAWGSSRVLMMGRLRVVADEMVVRGWLLGVQPGHGGPPTAHICLMPVHEKQTDVFLADQVEPRLRLLM